MGAMAMQRLLPILMSWAVLAAACSSSTPRFPNKDGGDATAKDSPGTGGISASPPDAVATGGIAGSGQDAMESGGQAGLGQGGLIVGTGGASTATSAISGTGGVAPGTGGSVGTGGAGSGGSSSGSMDAGEVDADKDAPSPDSNGPASEDAPATEDAPSSMSCTWKGKVYPHGTSWRCACNECGCENGGVWTTLAICGDAGEQTDSVCMYDGKLFQAGISFLSTDGCNLCECAPFWYPELSNGVDEAACTMRDCPTATVPDALPAIDAEADGCVYDGKLYPLDTYFDSADRCDRCHCRGDGQIACTLSHRSGHRDCDRKPGS